MKLYRIFIIVFLMSITLLLNVAGEQDYVYMTNGRLYFPDGKELSLWGVNFQPCLSWEYNDRLKKGGVQLTSADLKAATDSGLDELQKMGVNLIRCHLTPADFTDAEGNLVQTVYLDILDYMVSEAAKRNIYLYISFINHMGNYYLVNSFLNDASSGYRERWIYDKVKVVKLKTYITALLNRTNPYTQKTYKSTPAVALWEIINEPGYYSYDAIKNTTYYNDFLTWIAANRSGVNNSTTYADYRSQLVKNYINDMRNLIRGTGAVQPVVWNCNWYNMRTGKEDVFTGIAQSDADVVSFCCYPGQAEIPYSDYWNHPEDLTSRDYTTFFKNNYEWYNGYGWAKSSEFAGKAKVVYEFEGFFNQSSYLYPLMAQYFRSFGVQAAAMWTYNFSKAAPYANGSHFLSITCTPGKSMSFMLAHQVFQTIPLYALYNINSPNEQLTTEYAISKSKDLSIFSTSESYYNTGTSTAWQPFDVNRNVKNIYGRGNSQLVSYSGSGIYRINESNNELYISIEPDFLWIRPPWNSIGSGLVTQLDYTKTNALSIYLDNWGVNNYTVHMLTGTGRTKILDMTNLAGLQLLPGNYVIVKEATGIRDIENKNVKWTNNKLIFEDISFDFIKVFNLEGKTILSESIKNQNEVALNALVRGFYIVSLVGEKNVSLKIQKNN